jgi:hypothetical protein
VLILLSIKQLTKHPFVVRNHFIEIPEHFLDETANTLLIHDRGVVGAQPADEDLDWRELCVAWRKHRQSNGPLSRAPCRSHSPSQT